jgi:uncharacterized membrane protein YsdA (DUF1294 family)/cold shock CspA family protein
MRGVIVTFDAERGFGFIRSRGLDEDVFVHIREIQGGKPCTIGQNVTFQMKKTERGITAVNVVPGKRRISPYWLYGLPAVGLTLGLAWWLWQLGLPAVLAYLASVNLCTLLFYGYDKGIAGTRFLRVPERVLHALAFFGGSPLALLAQKLFRHKTLKSSFRLVYWAIVVVHAITIGGGWWWRH